MAFKEPLPSTSTVHVSAKKVKKTETELGLKLTSNKTTAEGELILDT